MTQIESCIATSDPIGRRLAGAVLASLATLNHTLMVLHDRLSDWSERAHQRRQLNGLPDYLLRDIGLSRADAEHEAGKAFWRG